MANSFTLKDQQYGVGDRILVHQQIVEEGKTRTQIFDGILIGVKGRGDNQSFTVRRIASNAIGVERIIPVKSPTIKKIDLKSKGHVRRAKLNYLRERVGRKATRVKEKKTYTTKSASDEPNNIARSTGRKSSQKTSKE